MILLDQLSTVAIIEFQKATYVEDGHIGRNSGTAPPRVPTTGEMAD
jgi:hypothetical protein